MTKFTKLLRELPERVEAKLKTYEEDIEFIEKTLEKFQKRNHKDLFKLSDFFSGVTNTSINSDRVEVVNRAKSGDPHYKFHLLNTSVHIYQRQVEKELVDMEDKIDNLDHQSIIDIMSALNELITTEKSAPQFSAAATQIINLSSVYEPGFVTSKDTSLRSLFKEQLASHIEESNQLMMECYLHYIFDLAKNYFIQIDKIDISGADQFFQTIENMKTWLSFLDKIIDEVLRYEYSEKSEKTEKLEDYKESLSTLSGRLDNLFRYNCSHIKEHMDFLISHAISPDQEFIKMREEKLKRFEGSPSNLSLPPQAIYIPSDVLRLKNRSPNDVRVLFWDKKAVRKRETDVDPVGQKRHKVTLKYYDSK